MGIVSLVIATALGYLIGAFPTAYLVGRANRIDIFRTGNGTMGANNTYHALGIFPAILVWAIDMSKGTLAVILARGLVYSDPTSAATLSGLAVVTGHVWSIWVWLLTKTLRGGKGASTAGGTWLAIAPLPVFAATVGLWGLLAGLTGYVPLATLCAFAVGSIWLLGLIAAGQVPPIATLYVLGVAAIVYWRHLGNARALLSGHERRLDHRLTKRAIASGGAAALITVFLSACVPHPEATPPLPTILVLPPDLTSTSALPPSWTPAPTDTPLPTVAPTITDTSAPTAAIADVCTSFKLLGAPAANASIAYDGSATFTWSGVPPGTAVTLLITLHGARAGLQLDDVQPGSDSVAVPLLQTPQEGQYDWKLWLHADLSATASPDPALTPSPADQWCTQSGTFTRLPLVMM